MKLGLLLFPTARASAQLARMAESMGFDSLVFADTQNITPEVWGQLMPPRATPNGSSSARG